MPDQVDAGYFTIPFLDYRFVEFVRIDTPADIEAVASAVLGEDYTSKAFEVQFGVSLKDYKGYYIEVTYTDAPRGPITPSQIEPILALRRSRSGQQFRPNVLKVPGYFDQSRKHAWIEAEVWEEHIGDDLAKKARARLRESEERLQNWKDSDEAQKKRKEVLDELLNLVRDPGVGNEDPDDGQA
jgi:hypothetical protein